MISINVTTKENSYEYKKEHHKRLENANRNIHTIFRNLQDNPYIYNRSVEDVRDFLWETASWKKEEDFYGVTHIEFLNMWEIASMFYEVKRFIDKDAAYAFYLNVKCVIYNGNVDHADSCSLTAEIVSNLLNLTIEETEEFFYAMKIHRITEKQGKGLVF